MSHFALELSSVDFTERMGSQRIIIFIIKMMARRQKERPQLEVSQELGLIRFFTSQ